MNISLSVPQSSFFGSTAKETCAVAGFGSGKTDVAMFRLITSCVEYSRYASNCYHNETTNWLYAAPTIPLIRDILWSKLDKFLPSVGLPYRLNKAESITYLPSIDAQIFCRSMDTPERLIGFEVVDAFLDEMDVLPKDKALVAYRKVKARCRQKLIIGWDAQGLEPGTLVRVGENRVGVIGHPLDDVPDVLPIYKLNQQWVTTTPEGFRATYEIFKKNPGPNTKLIQMSTYSNAHNLPFDYIDDLKNSYPPQLIEAYLNGNFVNLNALGVWSSYDQSVHHVDVGPIPGEPIHVGQDFNVGRGCAVVYVWRKIKGIKCLVAVDEVVDSFDTPDSVRALDEKFPRDIYRDRHLYPDSSGNSRHSTNATTSDLAIMRNAGFVIHKHNKNPAVKDRVISTNAAFMNSSGETRLYVNTNRCKYFSEALEQQAYDKNGLPEKGMNKYDDLTDSGSYPVYWFFPVKKREMFTTTVGGL